MISPQFCFIDPFQGYVGLKFVAENLKKSKGATLYNRAQAYSSGLNTNYKSLLGRLGHREQASGDNDFSAQLSAIKAAGAKVAFMSPAITPRSSTSPSSQTRTEPAPGGRRRLGQRNSRTPATLSTAAISRITTRARPRRGVGVREEVQAKELGKVPDECGSRRGSPCRRRCSRPVHGRRSSAAVDATKDSRRSRARSRSTPTATHKDAVVLEVVNGVPEYAAAVPHICQTDQAELNACMLQRGGEARFRRPWRVPAQATPRRTSQDPSPDHAARMTQFLQTLFDGLTVGSLLATVGIGLHDGVRHPEVHQLSPQRRVRWACG